MLGNKKELKLYNVFFPLWFLVWIPSYLWLILIPLNYALDTAVTWFTLKDLEDRKSFCIRNTWKICIVGFACDFVGSLIMLGISELAFTIDEGPFSDAISASMTNPWSNPIAFAIAVVLIVLVAFMLYFFDKKVLIKAGLTVERAVRSAKWIAIITAPYMFLFPSDLLYV